MNLQEQLASMQSTFTDQLQELRSVALSVAAGSNAGEAPNTVESLATLTKLREDVHQKGVRHQNGSLVCVPEALVLEEFLRQIGQSGNINRIELCVDDSGHVTNITGVDSKTFVQELRLLADLPRLDTVRLNHHKIQTLCALAEMPTLRTLSLENNEIDDLSSIPEDSKLENLTLAQNQFSSIQGIEKLTELKHLYIGLNLISDLEPLTALSKLETLNLALCDLQDVSFLSRMTSLRTIGLDHNELVELPDLNHLPYLRKITLGGNSLGPKAREMVEALRRSGVQVEM